MNKTKSKANKHRNERNNASPASASIDPRDVPDSKQQPVWHVMVLGGLTCGLPYIIYWAYKTWRDLKNEALAAPVSQTAPLSAFVKVNPLLQALGLLVPILNLYLLAQLVLGVANLDPKKDSVFSRKPLLTCLLVVGSFLMIPSLARLPGSFYMLSLLCPIPLALVQHCLNRYWRSVEPEDMSVRHAFSLGEMAAIILGAGLLGLVVAGQMMGVKGPS
jgi:hypothetical protein